jgi:hypothetical protein
MFATVFNLRPNSVQFTYIDFLVTDVFAYFRGPFPFVLFNVDHFSMDLFTTTSSANLRKSKQG